MLNLVKTLLIIFYISTTKDKEQGKSLVCIKDLVDKNFSEFKDFKFENVYYTECKNGK